MALSLLLEAGSPKSGLELVPKGGVAMLLADPLGLGVGFKGRTESSGALPLPPCDDACGDGAGVSFAGRTGPSNMPPVEPVTSPAGFETNILEFIWRRYDCDFSRAEVPLNGGATPFLAAKQAIDGDCER